VDLAKDISHYSLINFHFSNPFPAFLQHPQLKRGTERARRIRRDRRTSSQVCHVPPRRWTAKLPREEGLLQPLLCCRPPSLHFSCVPQCSTHIVSCGPRPRRSVLYVFSVSFRLLFRQ